MSGNLKEFPMSHYPHQKDCLGLMLSDVVYFQMSFLWGYNESKAIWAYASLLVSFFGKFGWTQILCILSCEEPTLTSFEFEQILRNFLHRLGLALLMGSLVVLSPFYGPSSSKVGLTRCESHAYKINGIIFRKMIQLLS